MERLWSPWRMEYIEAAREDEPGGCVFCALLRDGDADGDRVLAIEELAFVTLAKYPYNPGHLLILPVRHAADPEELTDEEQAAIQRLLHRSLRAVRAASDPQGFNIGLNLGSAAGAGIPAHLHWHVVPRWGGDTNFMPVVGRTRVLPELLQDTYRKLRPRFDEDPP
ncbi:MAG: HIT family protein [Actinomycetota bacterium]